MAVADRRPHRASGGDAEVVEVLRVDPQRAGGDQPGQRRDGRHGGAVVVEERGRPPAGPSSRRGGTRGGRRGRRDPDSTAGRAVPASARPAARGRRSGVRRTRPGRPGGRCPGAPPTRRRARRSGRAGRGRRPRATGGGQRGHHAVGRAVGVEHGLGDAAVGGGQPLDLVPHRADRVEAQVLARGGRRAPTAIIQSGQPARAGPASGPAGRSGPRCWWWCRAARGPRRPAAPRRRGRATAPGAVATATTNPARLERPCGQAAVGEVGERVGPSSTSASTGAPSGWSPAAAARISAVPRPGAVGDRAPGGREPVPAGVEGDPTRQDARGPGPCRGRRARCRAAGRAGTGPRAGRRPAAGGVGHQLAVLGQRRSADHHDDRDPRPTRRRAVAERVGVDRGRRAAPSAPAPSTRAAASPGA